jgi:hypothetical protein
MPYAKLSASKNAWTKPDTAKLPYNGVLYP